MAEFRTRHRIAAESFKFTNIMITQTSASANFSQTGCTVMNLTVDIIRPAYNSTTGVALPTGPMPVLLGVHGGSYTHGDSSEQVPNVEYFVQRGWVGFSINYRLCHQGPMLPPGATTSPATLSSSDGGNLVCGGYGSFPAVAPFGNASCSKVKTFGLNLGAEGCPLSSPPKNGSFFGMLHSWAYAANRDAKAAVRWIKANAASLQADPDLIAAIGGSAGACSVVGLATTFESDYKTELSTSEDPTLASTHLEQSSSIAAGLVQWGAEYVPEYAALRDPAKRSRFTKQSAPLATYHGSIDGVISPNEEIRMKAAYEANGVPYEQHILKGYGHDATSAPVTLPNGTNQSQWDSMFQRTTAQSGGSSRVVPGKYMVWACGHQPNDEEGNRGTSGACLSAEVQL
eukprot:gene29-1829_t